MFARFDLMKQNRKRRADDKTCRREQEVRKNEGWRDRQTGGYGDELAGGGKDINIKRRNKTRVRWRGGTQETNSE